MDNYKETYVSSLANRRREIKKYLQDLTVFDTTKLYQKLKDIFYIYGFSIEEVKRFLNYNGDFYDFTEEELKQMDGVSNALLFQLKYKDNSNNDGEL